MTFSTNKKDMSDSALSLKEAITNELYWEHAGFTDSQLAVRLGANEPSVRRARNQLVKKGVVREGISVFNHTNFGVKWVKMWKLTN